MGHKKWKEGKKHTNNEIENLCKCLINKSSATKIIINTVNDEIRTPINLAKIML